MAIAFRGQFYFAAEGHSYFAREGQRRLPSGVKHARLFHTSWFRLSPNNENQHSIWPPRHHALMAFFVTMRHTPPPTCNHSNLRPYIADDLKTSKRSLRHQQSYSHIKNRPSFSTGAELTQYNKSIMMLLKRIALRSRDVSRINPSHPRGSYSWPRGQGHLRCRHHRRWWECRPDRWSP